MVLQKGEQKDSFSFPTKYRPSIGPEIAVCDLVIAVCDLIILYRLPEDPKSNFMPHTIHMGPTKTPCKLGKAISGLPALAGFNRWM